LLFRKNIKLKTRKNEFIDLTNDINKLVKESKVDEGLCHVFLPATTAGLIMNENEKLLIEDFRRFFSKLLPSDKLYNHSSNAFSHLRANLASTEKTIPVSGGKLLLGTWQSIMLWEFDIENRDREIVITIISEKKPRKERLYAEEYEGLSEM
jgi:secondary thiamine-phosphate synthase enzyme